MPKKFSNLLQSLPFQPNPETIKIIDEENYPFNQNKVYNHKIELLAFREFERCLEIFQRRNENLSPQYSRQFLVENYIQIVSLEEPHLETLQNLAISLIKEIYQLPDYIDLTGFIKPKLEDIQTEQNEADTFSDISEERKKEMEDEIQKRIILNGLTHGSALFIWGGIYYMIVEEINKIEPKLIKLYDFYTSVIGISLWLINPKLAVEAIKNNNILTQGYVNLKFDKNKGFGGTIEANAINFPVLLHELNKGVIDWLISAGIPTDYTENELKYYYSQADKYEDEIFHYLFSPTLYIELLEVAEVENHNIPKLISYLTKLSYQKLVEVFNLIQDDKEKASKMIKGWKI